MSILTIVRINCLSQKKLRFRCCCCCWSRSLERTRSLLIFSLALFFSRYLERTRCVRFFSQDNNNSSYLERTRCVRFFSQDNSCIRINRSSNHGTIMWLLYEPTIITNLLYFLQEVIKCIPGRVRSGKSEVRICTCVSEFQFADKDEEIGCADKLLSILTFVRIIAFRRQTDHIVVWLSAKDNSFTQ